MTYLSKRILCSIQIEKKISDNNNNLHKQRQKNHIFFQDKMHVVIQQVKNQRKEILVFLADTLFNNVER